MNQRDVVLCNPVRTAIGTYGGSLKELPAPELGAAVIRETLKRAGLAPDKVQSVVMGNVIQAGVKMNPARQAAIAGGVPVDVPALTVNRVCVMNIYEVQPKSARAALTPALSQWARGYTAK